MTMFMNVAVSTDDIASACYDDGDFLANVLNRIGDLIEYHPEAKFRSCVLNDLVRNLDEQGKEAIRQLSLAAFPTVGLS